MKAKVEDVARKCKIGICHRRREKRKENYAEAAVAFPRELTQSDQARSSTFHSFSSCTPRAQAFRQTPWIFSACARRMEEGTLATDCAF